jgi:heme exporter protein B
MTLGHSIRACAWLVLKDLRGEVRVRRSWASMLLLGLVLLFFLELHFELPTLEKRQVVSGMLWLTVFFAGTLALERSFASEREEACWQALLLYPLAPTVIYVSKMAVNFIALVLVELLLVPALIVMSNVPLLEHPLHFLLIALLGNLGFVAVGVLVSAATTGLSHRGGLLILLQFPLLTPVMVGSAEATRLMIIGELASEWWRWIQMLAAFAILFTTVGILIFDFVVEE